MKQLLSIDLQKYWKNKASRILIFCYFIILSFIALLATVKFDFGIFQFHMAELGMFSFPIIWHFNTYVASIFKLFPAIVIVSMVSNEYNYGTLKQNLIDGMSKQEFILSKLLTIVLFASVSTVFIFLMSLFLGLSFSSQTDVGIVFSGLEYLLAYFVKLVGFLSFCLFLGILVKRAAFALGFLLVWNIIEGIIKELLPFNFSGEGNSSFTLSQFLPLESMSNLIVEPFTRLSTLKNIGTQIGIVNNKDYGVHWYGILIVLIWGALFILMSFKLLEKRDL